MEQQHSCAHKTMCVHLECPLQTKLYCELWVLKKGERFKSRRRETHPFRKQIQVLHP